MITNGKCFDFVDLVMKQASSSFGKIPKAKVRCFFEKVLSKTKVKKAIADSLVGTSSDTSNAVSDALGNSSETFKIFSDCKISPSALGS